MKRLTYQPRAVVIRVCGVILSSTHLLLCSSNSTRYSSSHSRMQTASRPKGWRKQHRNSINGGNGDKESRKKEEENIHSYHYQHSRLSPFPLVAKKTRSTDDDHKKTQRTKLFKLNGRVENERSMRERTIFFHHFGEAGKRRTVICRGLFIFI